MQGLEPVAVGGDFKMRDTGLDPVAVRRDFKMSDVGIRTNHSQEEVSEHITQGLEPITVDRMSHNK